MQISIKSAMEREVKKLIKRHNSMCRDLARNRERYTKRSGLTALPSASNTPSHWTFDSHFDPYYVRARFKKITYAITKKIRNNAYEPKPILLKEIPKVGGGTRKVSILTIPDAAVSYLLGAKLVNRNAHFFTSYTYAYRNDRNAHHAIQHLMTEIKDSSRLFAVEFDFSNYFDSIDHDYLLDCLDKYFLVSKGEKNLLLKMIKAPRVLGEADYISGNIVPSDRGIPQGSTISLFLANVACHELDKIIEHEGVVFARYADDTLLICDSYDKADRCARHFKDHGKTSGTIVNFNKSDGISMLTSYGKSEIKSKDCVYFLAHTLASNGVGVSPSSILRLKKKVAYIIHLHLLLQPVRKQVNHERFGNGFIDWDLVTCINELRRYIYGHISEIELNEALMGNTQFKLTRCALSFYPTVDFHKANVFKSLDGWLADTITRAYRKRVKLLNSLGISTQLLGKHDLIEGDWYSFDQVKVETKLPSFYKSWLYVYRCSQIFGLDEFPSPIYDYL